MQITQNRDSICPEKISSNKIKKTNRSIVVTRKRDTTGAVTVVLVQYLGLAVVAVILSIVLAVVATAAVVT